MTNPFKPSPEHDKPKDENKAEGKAESTFRPSTGSHEVNEFHHRDDVDSSAEAHHHTLGFKAGQAAPGNKVTRADLWDVKFTFAATEPADQDWKWFNGQAVSRTLYAAAFARFGTTYGAGDGSTTFNLPDFRGSIPINVAAATFTLLAEGGSTTKTITTSNMPTHAHSSPIHSHSTPAHTHTANVRWTDTTTTGGTAIRVQDIESVTGATGGTVDFGTITDLGGSGTSGNSSAADTGNAGSGTAFDIMPPWYGVNMLVKIR